MYEEALKQDQQLIGELLGQKDYGERVRSLASLKYARLSAKKDSSVSERKKETGLRETGNG